MTSELDIEDLRRRAKDNKANNASYFLSLSFDSIKELRNVLFTVPTLVFAYIQTGLGKAENPVCFKTFFALSFISGIISYILFLIASLKHSFFYSEREKVLSSVVQTVKQYENLIDKENIITNQYKNYWFVLSFILILLQLIFAILTFFQI